MKAPAASLKSRKTPGGGPWLQAVRGKLAAGGRSRAAKIIEEALAAKPGHPELLLWKARLKIASGDVEAAAASLEEAGRAPAPGYAVFLLRSGVRLLRGDCEGGWADLMRAYEDSPSFMFAYAEAGHKPASNAEWPWAGEDAFASESLLKALDKAVAKSPRLAAAWAWRGLMKRRLFDYAGCVEDLERAEALGLRSAMLLTWRGEARVQCGDAGGLEDMEAALALPCQAWNFAWLGRAKAAFSRDRGALRFLDEAVRREPANGWFLAWRAESKRLLGVRRGQLSDFDKALARDPGYDYGVWVRTWRGLACVQLGKAREALRDFDAVLSATPDYALAVIGRARARRVLGDVGGWLSDLDRAAHLDEKHVQAIARRPAEETTVWVSELEALTRQEPENAAAWRWLGFLTLLGAGAARAEGALRRAGELEPEDPWTWAWLGQARHCQEDAKGALEAYGRALRLGRGGALVHAWSAAAQLDLGRAEQALAALERAVAADARFASAWADLGRVRLMLGCAPQAAEALRRAVALEGRDASAWADLSVACARAGDEPGRLAAESRAKALDPEALARRLGVWQAG